jgi:periplasmic protein CpxP/Spy
MNNLVSRALLCLGAGAPSFAIDQTHARDSTAPAAFALAARGKHHFFSDATPTERMEARLNRMKGKLNITAAQQGQWDAYANILRKISQEREQPGQMATSHHSNDQHPNASEMLESEQALHVEAVTQLNELLAAEKLLFAALSPDQGRVADKVLNRSFGEHGRRMDFGSRHGHERFGRV